MAAEKHIGKQFRLETISWKTFLAAGFAALLGMLLTLVLIGELFHDISDTLIFLIFQICFSAAVLMFVLSLAKKRMEKGEIQTDRLHKALTPAQKCLIAAIAAFPLAWVFSLLQWMIAFTLCIFAGCNALLVAFVLFIIGMIVSMRRRREKRPAKKPRRVTCVKCGKRLKNDGTVPHMFDKYYCMRCYQDLQDKLAARKKRQYMEVQEIRQELVNTLSEILRLRRLQEKEQAGEIRKRYEERRETESKATCSICGIVLRKKELTLVDDRCYCESCFALRFPSDEPAKAADSHSGILTNGSAPEEASPILPDMFDREAFLKKYKSQIRPRLPESVEDPDTQERLLANLGQIFPSLQTVPASDLLLNQDSGRESDIRRIAHRVNSALAGSGAVWKPDAAENDQLIDAFLLLDYYAFLLKPDACDQILSAEAAVGSMLAKRLSEAG